MLIKRMISREVLDGFVNEGYGQSMNIDVFSTVESVGENDQIPPAFYKGDEGPEIWMKIVCNVSDLRLVE